jgi:hypothetical protein
MPVQLAHTAAHVVSPGTPIYDQALSSGLMRGLALGAAGAALAFIVAVVTIRVRREDLPQGMVVV